MNVVETCLEQARGSGARVVLPEWDAPRMIEARPRLAALGLVPIPVCETNAAHVDCVMAARGTSDAMARRMLSRPMIRAAAMVAVGEADILTGGIETPTRRVIEAARLTIGLTGPGALPSSFFVMVFPGGRTLIFADCAVNAAPDAAALAAIARSTARSAKALLGTAEVALLSYSTGTSGTGADVDRVRAAAGATGFAGPLQADAALNAAIAAQKGSGTGQANTLIFPSLDAGNIAYKLCQELAGAQAIGPFLQGFAKPVCDLSRGASTDDIVAGTAIALALHRRGA